MIFRRSRAGRISAIALSSALLLGQVGWSGAAFEGWLGPLRTYYRGFEAGIPALTSPSLAAVNLTKGGPSPAWFGGTSSLADLGIYPGGGVVETANGFSRRLLTSLASRTLITFYVVLLLAALAKLWGRSVRRTILYAVALVGLLPSVATALTVRSTIQFVPIDTAGPTQVCKAMQYSVQLSDDFWRRLLNLADRGMTLELFFRPDDDTGERADVEFAMDDQRLAVEPASDPGRWSVIADLRFLPRTAPLLRVTYRAERGVRYLGWQRPGLPGRSLRFEGCDQPGTAALPSLELRAVPSGGIPALIGF
jgi:hypothetical protein